MLIDMPITTETIDSSGEILHLKGLDIQDFFEDRAWANWEHNNDHADNILGKFVFAKKIFTKEDCDNERQRMYWDKLKTPFLYGICELMDEEGHPGAVCVAAMIRYFKKRNESIMVGASIEGQTLDRNDGDLLRTVGRRVAITLRPCNRQCWVDFLGEGADVDEFLKSSFDGAMPKYAVEVDSAILGDEFRADAFDQVRKALTDLKKTLEAGVGNVAPSSLTGGAALQSEHMAGNVKNRLRAALRDWNRARPLREVIKAVMPEVSDQYIDHFVDVAKDLALKKGMNPNLVRIGAQHAIHNLDNDQAKLVEGLYWDPKNTFDPGHEEMGSQTFKMQNDAGDVAFAKRDWSTHKEDDPDPHWDQPHKAPAYYRLAKDYFGMGNHVPVSVAVKHPKINQGQAMQIQTMLKDAQNPYTNNKAWREAAKRAREDGSLHKLAMMDMIMGNRDRHPGNVLIHDGRIYHVDNDQSFENTGDSPFYARASAERGGVAEDTLHHDASRWLQSLNPRTLALMASSHGILKGEVSGMLWRLRHLQEMDKAGFKIGSMADRLENTAVAA